MERLRTVFYRKPGPWFTIVSIPYRKRLDYNNFQYSVLYCKSIVPVAFRVDSMKNSFTFTTFILFVHHWFRLMIHAFKWFISLWLRYTPRLRWHFQIFSLRSLSSSLCSLLLLYILYVLSLSLLYLFFISTDHLTSTLHSLSLVRRPTYLCRVI